MKRLFFALWPEQTARQQCEAIIAKLNSTGKPVTAANLHVTLLFLGHLPSEQQAAITRDAARIPASLTSLTFDRLSFWKKPAVQCLTTDSVDQNIALLNENLAAIAKRHGIVIDDRPFTPHVTLMKKARSAIDIAFNPIIWHSDGFCLVESCPGTDGVNYRILKHWPSIKPLTPKQENKHALFKTEY